MNSPNVQQLIQERQNKFIETRTIIEKEVNMFLTSLNNLDPDIKEKLGVTEGINCRSLLPSLWAEPFDLETYNMELSKVQNYIAQVRGICDELNKEAIACLQS